MRSLKFMDVLFGVKPEKAAERDLSSSDGFAAMYQTWSGTPDTERMAPTFIAYASQGLAGNAAVYAVALARLQLFTQIRFVFQSFADEHIYGTQALDKLNDPWPGGTTAELLARMIQDVDLAGNSFIRDAGDRLERLRPDRVIITSSIGANDAREVTGYLYDRDGSGKYLEEYDVADVSHWSPIPDPLNDWRGMSWLTPVVREIDSDSSMTMHKQKFFDNAAVPNMVIKYTSRLTPERANEIRQRMDALHAGPANTGKTLVFDEGADVTFMGNNFGEMKFTALQAAGETRIAAAAGVPPIIAGLKEGLESGTYSNYGMAMRRFGEGTMAHLWASATASLAKLVDVPGGSRLWFDISAIAALQESLKDRADALSVQAQALSTLVMAGYTPETAINAVNAGDITLLTHSGKTSVQLYATDAAPPVPMTGATP